MAHAFATTPRELVNVRHKLETLVGYVLARGQKWGKQNGALQRLRCWTIGARILGPGIRLGETSRAQPADPCADLLRGEIARVRATLAPGGAWDRQIADAELRLKQLKTERRNAVRTVISLRGALRQVTRSVKTLPDESPRQNNRRR